MTPVKELRLVLTVEGHEQALAFYRDAIELADDDEAEIEWLRAQLAARAGE